MTRHQVPGSGRDSALSAVRRARELSEATDGRTVDLLVVGLGVTGAGVALDAASRGLDVVAVDAHDLARLVAGRTLTWRVWLPAGR